MPHFRPPARAAGSNNLPARLRRSLNSGQNPGGTPEAASSAGNPTQYIGSVKIVSANTTMIYPERVVLGTGTLTITLPRAYIYAGEFIAARKQTTLSDITVVAQAPDTVNGRTNIPAGGNAFDGAIYYSDGTDWYSVVDTV